MQKPLNLQGLLT